MLTDADEVEGFVGAPEPTNHIEGFGVGKGLREVLPYLSVTVMPCFTKDAAVCSFSSSISCAYNSTPYAYQKNSLYLHSHASVG